MNRDIADAVRAMVEVPAHIVACADAVRADLLYGPRYAHIPDGDITKFTDDHYCDHTSLSDLPQPWTEVYIGPVAQALRDFIDELSEAYVDEDGYVSTQPPEPTPIECNCGGCDGCEYCEGSGEQFMDVAYRTISRTEVVECLFGQTIAREFR